MVYALIAAAPADLQRGIKAYLERQGFEITEEGWVHGSGHIDFIADDEGEFNSA